MSDNSLFSQLYATRAAGFRPSPVRSVWDVMMEPGIISLAGGNPDLSQLPLKEIGQAAERMITERGTEVLQYGAGAGTPQLRNALVPLMKKSKSDADPENILVTANQRWRR